MALIDRVLPDAQALAREGGEHPLVRTHAMGCVASVLATCVIGVFALWVGARIPDPRGGLITPVTIAAATLGVVALRVAIDPSARRPLSANVASVFAAMSLAFAANTAASAFDYVRQFDGVEADFSACAGVAVLLSGVGLVVGQEAGAARSTFAPVMRVASAFALAALAALAADGALRRARFQDREAQYQAMPIVASIPPTRDEGGFWKPIPGTSAGNFVGNIGALNVVLHRESKSFDDRVEIETSAPKKTLMRIVSPPLASVAWRQIAVAVRHDPARNLWIFDDGARREAFILTDALSLRSSLVFPRDWPVPPPRLFVLQGLIGLWIALVIRLSPQRSRALAVAPHRREVLDPNGAPIVVFDAPEADATAYRGSPHRPAPRVFHGTLAALDEALIAERAARDSLALAVAALAAAPLVGAAFAGVMG